MAQAAVRRSGDRRPGMPGHHPRPHAADQPRAGARVSRRSRAASGARDDLPGGLPPLQVGPLGGSCRAAERCPQDPPLYDLPTLWIRSNGDNRWPSPELVGRADHPPRVVPARAPRCSTGLDI